MTHPALAADLIWTPIRTRDGVTQWYASPSDAMTLHVERFKLGWWCTVWRQGLPATLGTYYSSPADAQVAVVAAAARWAQ